MKTIAVGSTALRTEYVEGHVNLRQTFALAWLGSRRYTLAEAADRAERGFERTPVLRGPNEPKPRQATILIGIYSGESSRWSGTKRRCNVAGLVR
jgi:hypothetical protein